MTDALPALSRHIAAVLVLDPSVPALEYERVWWTWGDIAATADAVAPHVGPGDRVAVLLRNHPPQVGLFVGLLRAGACVVTVNPDRGEERVRADLASLGVDTVAGERADLEALAPAARWFVTDKLGAVEVLKTRGGGTQKNPGVAVEMLTSGTTGPPKRVPLSYEMFSKVLEGTKYFQRKRDDDVRLRSGVVIINSPMVHLGGLFRVLTCLNEGRSFCLLERFRVDDWVDAVRRHRPRTVGLVPAALRMVLDADVDPVDLESVRSVTSGTAPLAPEDADAFIARFGVPVLTTYAATEFGGSVAGWNLDDHRQFWATKRGSVGRAQPGCALRVVDTESGASVGADEEGLLEVCAPQLGDGTTWTRTTDLARIDADGFVWILGRADQAIIRGGFKIRPEDVRVALERDARVSGAAVVSKPDARLGAVPVAAVELRPGAPATTPDDLLAAAANVLARYELPAELRVVAELPRTPSGKVDLTAVRELMGVA
ncbi:MAG TPA: class I adenylate-forming enzyme family protein [Acidimicrobiia bacterium]|nr:class I adenylate-forming enzyme family protein [Acidimicrobiia bacterium]